MENITVPAKVLEDTMNFVETANAMAKAANDEIAGLKAGKSKAASAAKDTLKTLIDLRVVAPESRDKIAAMLAGHDTTLALLADAAEKIAELRETNVEPGAPSKTEKTATERPLGSRKMRECDVPLMEFLNQM